MIHITRFNPDFSIKLAETCKLIGSSNFIVHESVEKVTLHGSHGISGHARIDSDLDLALVVPNILPAADIAILLHSVIMTTINNWHGNVELDLAAIFDKSGCGLKCLNNQFFVPELCKKTIDCMGIYKIQRGFHGFVEGPEIDCSKMYPLITIWSKEIQEAAGQFWDNGR
jgi:hypothetical protein